MATALDLPPELRAAMAHQIHCVCPDCVRLIDIGSNHRYDCKCEVCARWWEAVGPEPDE